MSTTMLLFTGDIKSTKLPNCKLIKLYLAEISLNYKYFLDLKNITIKE